MTLTLYFETQFTNTALLTGYHLLGVGLAGFIFVPSARVWGKRHLYILGTVIIIISSIWGGLSNHNYNSLLAARVFQGIGLAPFEALVNASVGDLFFVHERGKRMALSNLALFGGAFFTPVIVGKMTSTINWQWTFFFCAIFTTVMLPLVIFCVPETAFVRPEHCNIDTTVNPSTAHDQVETQHVFADKAQDDTPANFSSPDPALDKSSNDIPRLHATTTRTSFTSKRNLRLFNGRKTNESFFKLMLRPFPLFLHPGILWACLIQGTMIGWTVLVGIVLAAIMLLPPLLFGEVQTGYMYTGAFIGALLGFALAGLISDPSARLLTRWNKGVYEPEFRMVLVIPQLIFGCAGLYGFGITSSDTYRYRWVSHPPLTHASQTTLTVQLAPDIFFALQVMGMVLGAVSSALYIVDAHRDISVEAFTCLLVFKNIFAFGLTFSGYDWLVEFNVRPVFVAIATTQVVICCLTIPMCTSFFRT